MCMGCYVSEYGAPSAMHDSTADVVRLIGEVYAENSGGGGLHIVLDDWNLEDDHVQWCIDNADLTPTELRCAELMQAMTLEERATALALRVY